MTFISHISSNMSGHKDKIVPHRYDCHPGDIVEGRYRVESVLGEGSFGCVYKVVDTANRVWALKLLRLWDVPSDIRQQLIDRFEMEFQTSRISNPNLVHSVDCGYLNGNPYIVMEFCDGGDLGAKIGKCQDNIAHYAENILSGLKALHREGKVHRDLKPENVLLTSDNVAKLTDFGISGDRNKRLTERNIFGKAAQVFGTYAYMPPEQVKRGKSTVLPTTDIFSFGVVIYQLLTGVLPFGKLDDHNDLVYYQKKGASGDWDRTSLLNTYNGAKWEPLIAGCLVPDYKQRLQNVDEVLRLIPNQESFTPKVDVAKQYSISASFVLRVMEGVDFGQVYNLEDILKKSNSQIITVGRDSHNTIQLHEYTDIYTSRRHFTLEKTPQGVWMIRDGQWLKDERTWKNSMNGTYVNSQEVTMQGVSLKRGDIISAGEIKLRFETL